MTSRRACHYCSLSASTGLTYSSPLRSRIQNQHSLRAGRPESILTSPDTRMHVGEMSVSAVQTSPRERGVDKVDLTPPLPSLIDKQSIVLPYVKSSISTEQLTLCSNLKESGVRHEPWKKGHLDDSTESSSFSFFVAVNRKREGIYRQHLHFRR
jgi:hypothetical protein